jgi:hypothetical protein
MKANLLTFRPVYERLLAFTHIDLDAFPPSHRARAVLDRTPYMSLHLTRLYGFNEISG